MPENEIEEVFQPEKPSHITEMLQKTPWWAISVAFHAVVLLILWKLNFSIGGPKRVEVEIVARLEKKEEAEYDPEKPRDIKKKTMTEVESSDIDAPQIETEVTEYEDHFETDDNMELSETAKGFEDAMSLEDAGSIGVIGQGGGRGKGRYGFRSGGGRRNAVRRGGGGKDTESAVEAGLRWLARHQSPDGAWHTNAWIKECPAGDSCVGRRGGRMNDTIAADHATAITGFALLAYLGAGHTHQTGSFRKTVKNGLNYLQKAQASNGKFGPGDMYTHGIACLAAVEAFGMTRSKRYQKMAQDGIDYIVNVQNPLGGWNYSSPSPRNDMSVCGWQIMSLKSAKVGGLNVPDETIQRTIRWLDIATNESTGAVCYSISGNDPKANFPGGGGSIRMRAAGMLCHLFFGKDRNDHIMKASGDEFLRHLPVWAGAENAQSKVGSVDLYYWYYATLVNFQLSGKYWKGWNKAMKTALLQNQVKGKVHADGSWPPVDLLSDRWSRPGITALCVLSLEVYYRYLPLYIK